MTPIESKIIDLIEARGKVLVYPSNGTDPLTHDFIKSGAIDSLAIIRFVIELEQTFGVEIPMASVATCEFRTVRGVAAVIEELQG